MCSGPFKSFWHERRFVETDAGTVLDDHVRFEASRGLLGAIAERAVPERYRPHLIDVRNEFLVSEAARR